MWIVLSKTNASRVVAALREFGFDLPELSEELFTASSRIMRMGREPMQIEILNSVSGLDFADAVKRAIPIALRIHAGFTAPVYERRSGLFVLGYRIYRADLHSRTVRGVVGGQDSKPGG